ncbi:MAG: trypsin-like peptidase domain-containing protein [Pseudomonadota bacterium]|nr:trypsin-like peptidase domain-containing protein [Pseudomonadota bacterium]
MKGALIPRARQTAASLVIGVCMAGAPVLAAPPLETALQSVVSVLPEWPADARRTEEPEASGVVLLDGATVVTALHVVDKALGVRVRTAEGTIVTAEIAGRDKATDIAVLKLPVTLIPLEAAANGPALGDRVCAIGNAFGLGLSVTCGSVSGVHRAGTGFNAIEDFVQTDAAVNPGASGGALVTPDGKFVGLLSAIFTKTSDANIGVNFAVSAPLALQVAGELKEKGRIIWPSSGLRLEPAPGRGQTGMAGARVVAVAPGFPGEAAGIRSGDVILRAGGRRVMQPAEFLSAFATTRKGEALKVDITRDGAEQALSIRP